MRGQRTTPSAVVGAVLRDLGAPIRSFGCPVPGCAGSVDITTDGSGGTRAVCGECVKRVELLRRYVRALAEANAQIARLQASPPTRKAPPREPRDTATDRMRAVLANAGFPLTVRALAEAADTTEVNAWQWISTMTKQGLIQKHPAPPESKPVRFAYALVRGDA